MLKNISSGLYFKIGACDQQHDPFLFLIGWRSTRDTRCFPRFLSVTNNKIDVMTFSLGDRVKNNGCGMAFIFLRSDRECYSGFFFPLTLVQGTEKIWCLPATNIVTRSHLLQTWCHQYVSLVYLAPFQIFTSDQLIIVTASCASSYSSICFTGTSATFREDVNKSMTLLSPAPRLPNTPPFNYALDIISSLSLNLLLSYFLRQFLSLSFCLSLHVFFSHSLSVSLTPSPFLSLCPPSFHSAHPILQPSYH